VERLSDDPSSPSYKEDRKRFVKLFGGSALEKAGVAAVVQQLTATVRSCPHVLGPSFIGVLMFLAAHEWQHMFLAAHEWWAGRG
jgi:hypothetical protein